MMKMLFYHRLILFYYLFCCIPWLALVLERIFKWSGLDPIVLNEMALLMIDVTYNCMFITQLTFESVFVVCWYFSLARSSYYVASSLHGQNSANIPAPSTLAQRPVQFSLFTRWKNHTNPNYFEQHYLLPALSTNFLILTSCRNCYDTMIINQL